MWVSTVCGNVGSDGELKYLQSGDAVLNFSVAHSDKDRDKKETTVWIRCAMFGKRAEALAPHITKGKSVTVVGAMTVRSFEAQGEKRQSVEMKLDHLFFGGSAPRAEGGGQPVERGGGYQRPGPGRAPAAESDNTGGGGGYGGGSEEDIPFASCSPADDSMMRGMATA